MSYQGYVVAAYAVFAIVLLWDAAAPLAAIRQLLRAARLRATRDASGLERHNSRPPGESRDPS